MNKRITEPGPVYAGTGGDGTLTAGYVPEGNKAPRRALMLWQIAESGARRRRLPVGM
ncbi:hypothetical protein ACFWHQ_26685 [Streptomyces sp. NPDC060334]|uniref:hypothetical protein n=1 Tax=Streptomyces sp. NPDC060334 TaxID=3347099 RepID=UPI00366456D8